MRRRQRSASTTRMLRSRAPLISPFMAAAFLVGCCPIGKCDYAFRPNWDARHQYFVENLNAAVGRKFADQCLTEGACPPHKQDTGLLKYTAVDYRPWLKGCTYWFNVDPSTNVVVSVGYVGGIRECSSGPIR